MENSLETREAILCAAELIRYIFDKSKRVVPLRKEIEAVNIYIETFIKGIGNQISFDLGESLKDEETYIDHLDILSFIINDVENSLLMVHATDVLYTILDSDDLKILKLVDNETVMEIQISKR
jgi:LytS/YehU family sensor histidine kinase